jgi:hypothetical protein
MHYNHGTGPVGLSNKGNQLVNMIGLAFAFLEFSNNFLDVFKNFQIEKFRDWLEFEYIYK